MLVPLDGSAESERVLQWVAPLAARTGAVVTLLGVLEQPAPNGYATHFPPVADPAVLAAQTGIVAAAERGRERALKYLDSASRKLPPGASKVRAEVAFGPPGDMIAQVAGAEETDMVAMATRRESALARGILGSATARVLELHACPTLVVRTEERGPVSGAAWPENIIVPLDVSPLSETAVDPAISLAKALGAKLRFLRVTPRMYYPYPVILGDTDFPGSGLAFGRELRQEAFEYLAPFVDRAVAAGVDAFADARSGPAAARIMEALEEAPGSLGMMTSHGRGGFTRWAMGSVTDKVVRSSSSPVLVLPPAQPEQAA